MSVAAGLLAWNVEVPDYADGSGVILAEEGVDQRADWNTQAVVFLPPHQATQVRVGLPADLEVGSTRTHVRGLVTRVTPGVMSPEAARREFRLAGAGAVLITEPSVVAVIGVDSAMPADAYSGSAVTAKVEVGSRRLLALLPGVGTLLENSP